ncbi:MAG: NAD-dependent deacylase [Halobacteriota archaeon]|nr:NAD-dependent deacylase [Halobacteriota archaeon]
MGVSDPIGRVAEYIVSSKRVISLTGAGISTESGISDFRGPNGLWKRYDPDDFSIERFLEDPARFWRLNLKMREDGFEMSEASPNPAHIALARLEELGFMDCIITQNVDNLHFQAGSSHVIEFHGNSRRVRCLSCGNTYTDKVARKRAESGELPPRCDCGGVLKPDAVFFGEMIPTEALEDSEEQAKSCDMMLVIGTSASIYPAAALPRIAKEIGGAKVVEINAEPTALTGMVSDLLIMGKASEILSAIVREVEELIK